jgi:hypothetical protein
MNRNTPLYRTYATRVLRPVKPQRSRRAALALAALALLLAAAAALGYGSRTSTVGQNVSPTAAPRSADTRDALVRATAVSQTVPAANQPASTKPVAARSAVPAQELLFLVVGTDSMGVRMRTRPTLRSPVIVTVPEGATVVAVGQDVAADGHVWRPVRDETGQEGWVAADYLAP